MRNLNKLGDDHLWMANTSGDSEDVVRLLATILGRGRNSGASLRCSSRLVEAFTPPNTLTRASVEEIRISGRISPGMAATIHAALELGSRLCSSPIRLGERFHTSQELFQRYRARFFSAGRECFFSLHLTSKNALIREVLVSVGSLSTSVVHPREVFSAAVRDNSAAVIFFHNHPSGDPTPSREDRDCTQRLVHAGRILGIRVLDHIVFGHESYFSFADQGLLPGFDESP